MEQLSIVMEGEEEEIQAAIKGTGEMHRTTAAQREQEVGTTATKFWPSTFKFNTVRSMRQLRHFH